MIPTLQLGQYGRAGKVAAAVPPLALDIYQTGLFSAYGITKLISSYAGSAIRVRKSTGGDTTTQQDIGFSGTALDTTSLATFAGSESVVVTKVYDQSGNGNDLVQATTTKQPRIVNAGVYDGFIRFDGTAHFMTVSSGPAVAAITAALKYKIRTNSGANQNYIAHQNGFVVGNNSFAIQEQSDGGDSIRAYMFTGTQSPYVQNNFSTIPTSDGVDMWVANRAASGTARMARYRNGSSVSPSSSPGTSTSAGNFTSQTIFVAADGTGAAAFATMNLYTLAIWSTAQDANAAGIGSALA